MNMTTHKPEIDRQETLAHLSEALDSILTLFVIVQGGLPTDLPFHSFDQALLLADEGYQEARAKYRAAWDALMESVPVGETNPLAMDLEAACNEVVTQGAEVGWRLAMAAGVGRRGRKDGSGGR